MSDKLPVARSEYVALMKRIPSYAGLSKRLVTEARLNKKQKIILGAGLGYLASPIDLIPGFIPVLGQLDDILVVLLSVRHVLRSYDREAADEMLAAQGLSRELIDADIVLVKETMKSISRKAASLVWGGMSRAGKTIMSKIRPTG